MSLPPACVVRGRCTRCWCEILPDVRPLIIVEFTVRLGYAIFAVATLSYLGFGIQPPTPYRGADTLPRCSTPVGRILVANSLSFAGRSVADLGPST